jgi:hypothetical protein
MYVCMHAYTLFAQRGRKGEKEKGRDGEIARIEREREVFTLCLFFQSILRDNYIAYICMHVCMSAHACIQTYVRACTNARFHVHDMTEIFGRQRSILLAFQYLHIFDDTYVRALPRCWPAEHAAFLLFLSIIYSNQVFECLMNKNTSLF